LEGKKITFFVVSDSTQATRKFSISLTSLRVSAFLFVTTAVLLTAFGLDYFSLLLESHENKMLKADNLQLKNQFQVVETKLSALENALERVKTFSTKLKLITNVEDQNRGLKLAMTAGPKPNQPVDDMNEPVETRGPANLPPIDGQEETPIDSPQAPPTNDAKGELAVEGNRDYKTLAIRLDGALKDTGLREQSVLEVWESLSERQSLLNATPSLKPARGWYTSKFGYRISPFTGRPAMHAGLDIASAPGSPVFAPADGVVTYASYDEGYGKLVTIDHGYGVVTRFGHNSQIYVQVGQRVSRWDVISAVGNTGRSTGPHLHYEVRVNNVPVDPANYILDE
jgi:murein DD-endopeptidase MepM/ murein hydrolase activator NlpD